MAGPAIIEIIPIDRCDHHMRKTQAPDGSGDILRFVRIDTIGPAGCDVGECAGPGAHAAQDHHGRMLLLPAFADVRTGRFFAHGVEVERAHELAGCVIFRRSRSLDPDPVGLAWGHAGAPVHLLRMAWAGDRVGDGAGQGRTGALRRNQMWRTLPYAARTLSWIISESVGCGKMLAMSSASVDSRVRAMAKPWISSVTSAPIM